MIKKSFVVDPMDASQASRKPSAEDFSSQRGCSCTRSFDRERRDDSFGARLETTGNGIARCPREGDSCQEGR
jgi:hypothetical protein